MTELSPAAEAVLDAALPHMVHRYSVAAALRAAADQVVPEEPEPRWWEPVRSRFYRQCLRRRFLTIAAELEAQ